MRKGGIEILRLLAMLFVVTLHVLGSGGILNNVSKGSESYFVLWMLEIIACVAVNLFGLISGYVMWDKEMTVGKFVTFYGRVFFFTFAIWIVTRLFGYHEATMKTMFSMSLSHNTGLWYVNSYLALMILMPILNVFLQRTEGYSLRRYGGILFLTSSVLPFLLGKDLWNMKDGYSVMWLSVLYVLGGTIAKCEIDKKLSKVKWGVYYAICVALLWGSKWLIEMSKLGRYEVYEEYNVLVTYVSPLMLLASICLFCVFSAMAINLPKWFYRISGASFGVYLIHMHYFLFARLVTNRFVIFLNGSAISMFANVCWGIIKIFVCSLLAGIVLEFFYIMLCKLLKKLVGQIRKKKACT